MNKARRAEAQRAINLIEEARLILETCASEEREYFDNMPEGLQAGEKGMKADECATALEEADGKLTDLLSELEGAIE